MCSRIVVRDGLSRAPARTNGIFSGFLVRDGALDVPNPVLIMATINNNLQENTYDLFD